jgi:hypothetical protein
MGGNVIEVSSNEEWASKIKQTTEFGGKAVSMQIINWQAMAGRLLTCWKVLLRARGCLYALMLHPCLCRGWLTLIESLQWMPHR